MPIVEILFQYLDMVDANVMVSSSQRETLENFTESVALFQRLHAFDLIRFYVHNVSPWPNESSNNFELHQHFQNIPNRAKETSADLKP